MGFKTGFKKLLRDKQFNDNTVVNQMDYADGFRHGFDAGQASCVGDVSVTTLIKELVDRGELDKAKWLIDELQSRQD